MSEYRVSHLFKNNNSNNTLILPSEIGLVYIRRILPKIMRFMHMDCVMSCGMLYRRNINWEKALSNGSYPFYCMHREAIGLSKRLSSRINKSFYSLKARKYYGSMLFVGVHHFKNLLLSVGYIEKERVKVTGSIKIDNLVDMVNKDMFKCSEHSVVLFSFLYTSGIMTTDGKWSGVGFSKLFNEVHGVVGKFAHMNPSIKVVIKIKWYEKEWIDKIHQSISNIGLSYKDISNLTIKWDVSAQELISRSSTIVGFNSTVITESLLMRKSTIIPIYEEANDKCREDVLWSDTNDCCIARSNKELFDLLEESIIDSAKCYHPETDNIMTEAFGYIDGKNSNRLINEMTNYINTNVGL